MKSTPVSRLAFNAIALLALAALAASTHIACQTPPATQPAPLPGQLRIGLPDGTEAVITPKAKALAEHFRNDPSQFARRIKQLVEGELITDLGKIPVGLRREFFLPLSELATIEYRGKPDRPDPRPQISQVRRAENRVYELVEMHFPKPTMRTSVEKVLGPGKWMGRDWVSGSFGVQYAISPQKTVDANYSKDGYLVLFYLTPEAQDEPRGTTWEARLSAAIDSYLRIRQGVAAFLMKVEPALLPAQVEARMDQAIRCDGKADLAMVQRLVAARIKNGSPVTQPAAKPAPPAIP